MSGATMRRKMRGQAFSERLEVASESGRHGAPFVEAQPGEAAVTASELAPGAAGNFDEDLREAPRSIAGREAAGVKSMGEIADGARHGPVARNLRSERTPVGSLHGLAHRCAEAVSVNEHGGLQRVAQSRRPHLTVRWNGPGYRRRNAAGAPSEFARPSLGVTPEPAAQLRSYTS